MERGILSLFQSILTNWFITYYYNIASIKIRFQLFDGQAGLNCVYWPQIVLVFGVDPSFGKYAHLLPLLQPSIDCLLADSFLLALLVNILYFIHLLFHILLLILQNYLSQNGFLFLVEASDIFADHSLILVSFDLPAVYFFYQIYFHFLLTISLNLCSYQKWRIVLDDESDHNSDILRNVVHPIDCDFYQFEIKLQTKSPLNLI